MFAELLFIIKVIVFVFVGVNVLFFLFLVPVFNDPVVLILVGFFIFVGVLILAKMDNHSENKKREKANLKKKKAEIQNEILESVFDKKGMSTRLKEFVLQYTKKYDNNQINQNDYLDRIDMFLIYINNKNSCIQDNTGCRVENENITINRKSIVKFINSRKLQIYVSVKPRAPFN